MSGPESPPSKRPSADVDALLRAFVEEPVPPMASADAKQLRDRITQNIERQRRLPPAAGESAWKSQAWLLFAAAACLPVVIWASATLLRGVQVSPHGDAAVVTSLSGRTEIARGDVARSIEPTADVPVGQGDELRTGQDASARASLPTGAVVDVGPQARVRFVSVTGGSVLRDRLELVGGRIEVQVPKLRAGDELRVQTADATVVVHGTKFSVERVAPTGERPGGTLVAVVEGIVTVDTAEGERTLTAGMRLVTIPDAPHVDSMAAPTPAPGSVEEPQAARPSIPPSTLGAENALLTAAMKLRRTGQADRALAQLHTLEDRYPASPLKETARVERLQILEEIGATDRLEREAARYLADYPKGYAREEASRMLASSRAPSP